MVAWYPITPSSSLCETLITYMRKYRMDKETGKATFAIVQAEDEIASLGMVLGAGWAGARAMTAAKRKARGGRTGTARRTRPAGARPKPGGATRPDGEVAVRMYNVGFGDCFLITFPAPDRPRKVLVDCGFHAAGPPPRRSRIRPPRCA